MKLKDLKIAVDKANLEHGGDLDVIVEGTVHDDELTNAIRVEHEVLSTSVEPSFSGTIKFWLQI